MNLEIIEKLKNQVHTIPSIRNKMSPINNLIYMLTMGDITLECENKELLKIVMEEIKVCKDSIDDLCNPSKLENPFYDIDL